MTSVSQPTPNLGSERLFSTRTIGLIAVAVVAVLLAASIGWWAYQRATQRNVTAYFDRGVGIYEGTEIRVLGVKVGTVDSIEPQGDQVKVKLHVDNGVDLPKDLYAAQITPSVVADRYVQLLPVYTGGPKADDGAVIARDHTMTPVEIDQVYGSLDELASALGPEGVNKDGALSEFVDVSAQNLAENGEAMAATIDRLSAAANTLSHSKDNFAATITSLNTFVTMLTQNDEQVRQFTNQLSSFTKFVDDEREDLGKALNLLSTALGDVAQFVADNRDAFADNVHGLVEIAQMLFDTRDAQAQLLSYMPVAASNLVGATDMDTGVLNLRLNLPDIQDPFATVCKLLDQSAFFPGNPSGIALNAMLSPVLSQCREITGQIAAGVQNPTLNLPFGLLSGTNQQTGVQPGTVPGVESPDVSGVLPSTPAGQDQSPAGNPEGSLPPEATVAPTPSQVPVVPPVVPSAPAPTPASPTPAAPPAEGGAG